MAVTGVIMILFLIAHLAGNLLVFAGAAQIDSYAAFLQRELALLWITHLGLLPQGQPERARRVLAMVARMDEEGFGNCTWHGKCIDTIARMNGDWLRASWPKKRSHHEPKEPT
jgi:hypothetical protein